MYYLISWTYSLFTCYVMIWYTCTCHCIMCMFTTLSWIKYSILYSILICQQRCHSARKHSCCTSQRAGKYTRLKSTCVGLRRSGNLRRVSRLLRQRKSCETCTQYASNVEAAKMSLFLCCFQNCQQNVPFTVHLTWSEKCCCCLNYF